MGKNLARFMELVRLGWGPGAWRPPGPAQAKACAHREKAEAEVKGKVLEQFADVMVFGSGLAGFGLCPEGGRIRPGQSGHQTGFMETSTSKAQGGIAAVLGPDDRFEYHIEDTLTVGEGLSIRTSWSWWCARGRRASGN